MPFFIRYKEAEKMPKTSLQYLTPVTIGRGSDTRILGYTLPAFTA